MARHARIFNGAILQIVSGPVPSRALTEAHPTKPHIVPVVEIDDAYDANTETLRPEVIAWDGANNRVTATRTKRRLTAGELRHEIRKLTIARRIMAAIDSGGQDGPATLRAILNAMNERRKLKWETAVVIASDDNDFMAQLGALRNRYAPLGPQENATIHAALDPALILARE